MKVGLYFSFTLFSFNALSNKKIRFYLGRLDWWKDHFKNRLVCLENLSNFFYTKWNLSQRLSFVSCWSIFVTCVNNCHKSLLTALCVKMCGELVCGKSGHFVITIFLSQSQQQHIVTQPQHSCWVGHKNYFANPTHHPTQTQQQPLWASEQHSLITSKGKG